MKRTKFLVLIPLLALMLSSCSLFGGGGLDESVNMDEYNFTTVDDGDKFNLPDQNEEIVPHTPYDPVEVPDPVDPTDINEHEDPVYPENPVTYPEVIGPVDEEEEEDPHVSPSTVKYAITDLSKSRYGETLNVVEDETYYANLAINLAENEISHMGFETFKAIAVVFDETTNEVDHYVPGIAFTDGTIYDFVDNEALFSCGFIQIKQEGEEIEFLMSDTRGANLIDVSSGIMVIPNDEQDNRKFIIESSTIVEGFSGIYGSYYFSYKQESTFVLSVDVKRVTDNIEEFADEELDLYDFNKNEYLYKASIFHKQKDLSAFGLYGERGMKAYNAAVQMMDEAIRIQEENGMQIALNNIIVVSPELLDSIDLASQRESVNNMVLNYLSAIELKENEYLMLSRDGEFTIGVDYNYSAARESNLSSGIIKTLTSIGMLGAGFACMIATGGAATPLLAGLMFCGAAGTVTFAASELCEGVQQLYAGATGLDDVTPMNPIRDLFMNVFGDEEGQRLYYAAGMICMLSCAIFGPINTVLSSSSVASGIAGVAQTVLSITRVTVVALAKIAASAGMASLVYKVVDKASQKLGLSELQSKLLSYGSAALAGFLTYKGLDNFDKAFNLSGFAKVSPIDPSELGNQKPGPTPDPIRGRIKPSSNDVDMVDGVYDHYMTKNYQYKSQWAKDMVNNNYMDQGLTTSIKVKTYVPDEFVLEPFFRKRNADSEEEEFSPIAGYYDPETHTIYLDGEVLDKDGVRTLRTIAHLMRHVYQFEHAEFNSPVMKALRKDNYVNYDESLYDYLNNPAEIDANAYADYVVARAYAAYQAKLEDADIVELISSIEFPDPETFKEAM